MARGRGALRACASRGAPPAQHREGARRDAHDERAQRRRAVVGQAVAARWWRWRWRWRAGRPSCDRSSGGAPAQPTQSKAPTARRRGGAGDDGESLGRPPPQTSVAAP